MLQGYAFHGVCTQAMPIQGSQVSVRSPGPRLRGNTSRLHSSSYHLNKPSSSQIRPCTVRCMAHTEISHREDTTAASSSRAIVIGAGMAGLASASSLSSVFDEVILLERDTLPAHIEVRDGDSSCCRSCAVNLPFSDQSAHRCRCQFPLQHNSLATCCRHCQQNEVVCHSSCNRTSCSLGACGSVRNSLGDSRPISRKQAVRMWIGSKTALWYTAP